MKARGQLPLRATSLTPRQALSSDDNVGARGGEQLLRVTPASVELYRQLYYSRGAVANFPSRPATDDRPLRGGGNSYRGDTERERERWRQNMCGVRMAIRGELEWEH
jgi:hypothetical protein